MNKIALTTYYFPSEKIDKKRVRGVNGQDMIITALDYMNFIYNSGAIPIVVAPMKNKNWINDIVNLTDALVLSGGEDSDPSFYSEEKSPFLGEIIRERDIFELKLIDAFIKAGKPILGICRGFQLLNIYFNGTLYQDYRDLNPKLEYHCENPYQKIIHKIKLNPLFEKIYGVDTLEVNSHHHQFIKKLGEDLEVTAISPDGVIEAFVSKKYSNILGVQWHPEMLYSKYKIQTKLMNYFLSIINNKI